MVKQHSYDGETYYPVTEAAALLGCSVDSLYRAIQAGKVRVPSIGPKRISTSEIKRLLDGEPMPAIELSTTKHRQRCVDAVTSRLEAMGFK